MQSSHSREASLRHSLRGFRVRVGTLRVPPDPNPSRARRGPATGVSHTSASQELSVTLCTDGTEGFSPRLSKGCEWTGMGGSGPGVGVDGGVDMAREMGVEGMGGSGGDMEVEGVSGRGRGSGQGVEVDWGWEWTGGEWTGGRQPLPQHSPPGV